MKIIIFSENIQNGGLDTFCSTLINHWPNDNDSISFICNRNHPGIKNLETSINRKCNFIYHKIPLSWAISRSLSYLLPFHILRKASQPFIRIVLLPIQYWMIRRIFNESGGDELLVVNGGFPGGESCRIANIVWFNMKGKAGVHNFHNFAVVPRFGFGWYENWLDRLLDKCTKSFISVSRSCSESIKARDTFKDIKNLRYIYNGIKDVSILENSFNIRKITNIGDKPLCLMLGTYEARKGHQFIFKAFEQVVKSIPDAQLVICGGGTDNEISDVSKLKNKSIACNNIYLFEFIPDGASLISQADILLIGSQEFESFGLTAVESMIRKKPVISTNVGGLPEVIGMGGVCGYVVAPDDILGFSNRIISLLKDKDLRELMGESGKVRALECFSAERMSKEYLNAIRRL